jgi:hypothetical protein
MKDINEFYAEKCRVELWTNLYGFSGYNHDGGNKGHPWAIQDPRCREIIREKFNVQTQLLSGEWCGVAAGLPTIIEFGKTIAEAEIVCLEAIYKAEVEE